jgi:[acyl-carrier-protein] S-malonyltransferase
VTEQERAEIDAKLAELGDELLERAARPVCVTVERACERARALGAKRAVPLAVSAPFHSSLLRPAGERLARALASVELRAPQVPLVNNVDVAIETEPARIRDALVRQSYGPVRWVEVVQRLKALGVTRVIEFGPGKVLSGLVSRIDRSLAVAAVYDPESLAAALNETA